MKIYTVDLDVFKPIVRHVSEIQWRVSSSGLGYHFWWICPRNQCKVCRTLQAKLNDPKRQAIDAVRPPRMRGVLFDTKGLLNAGAWNSVRLPK